MEGRTRANTPPLHYSDPPMFRFLRENFILKIIALVSSVTLWLYVSSERNPVVARTVNAEPQLVGSPRADLIVKLRADPIPVEISGPTSEVESIGDNDIKAVVNQRGARPNVPQIRISRFEAPTTAPNVTFRRLREYAAADVFVKLRKRMPILPQYSNIAPFGRGFAPIKLDPAGAYAVGTADDLQKVDRLVVFVETRGGSVISDLPIQPLDKNGVALDKVQVEPEKTRVELSLVDVPATRTLLVSVRHQGRAAFPYEIADISVKPDQVTVTGRADQLLQMTSVNTAEVSLDGIMSDVTRVVPLRLPDGVTVKDSPSSVTVTVKVRDTSRQAP